jgi:hypothetical protein
MGEIETKMVNFIRQRIEQGVPGVTEAEIMAAIVPADHPEYRLRPAYRYGLNRLRVRGVVNAWSGARAGGASHYYIGNSPSPELLEFLSQVE